MIFTDWFVPGYKAGGPIRSLINFTESMKSDYSLYVFTTDRDLGETAPYKNIVANCWTEANGYKIYYCSLSAVSRQVIYEEITRLQPNFIYINSMFSRYFAIFPLWLTWHKRIHSQVVLSPRGMLAPSALRFKPIRKKIFLTIAKFVGAHRSVHFHATDPKEATDIARVFGSRARITVAANFSAPVAAVRAVTPKRSGEVRIIFVGRIHPIKNLLFFLQLLQEVHGNVTLTIVGNKEDKAYWTECEQLIRRLPANITIRDIGEIPHARLGDIFAEQHIFALPTRGENFGHAIFDALAAGKPALISDQTPWKNLAASHAGWDVPLKDPLAFHTIIEQTIEMDQQQFDQWSAGAWNFARNYIDKSDLKMAYKNIFE